MELWYKVELRSVDAVRHDGDWSWNESHVIETDILWHELVLTPRLILRQLRKWGYLAESSKGKLRVVAEDSVIEIQDKNTGRPILALLLLETLPA